MCSNNNTYKVINYNNVGEEAKNEIKKITKLRYIHNTHACVQMCVLQGSLQRHIRIIINLVSNNFFSAYIDARGGFSVKVRTCTRPSIVRYNEKQKNIRVALLSRTFVF